MNAADYEVKLAAANARADVMVDAVQTFLRETGAPTLDEVKERLDRFARNNRELEDRAASLAAKLEDSETLNRQMVEKADRLDTQASNLRKELAQVIQSNAANADVAIRMRSVLEHCRVVIQSPSFASIGTLALPTLKMINAVIGQENREVASDAPSLR